MQNNSLRDFALMPVRKKHITISFNGNFTPPLKSGERMCHFGRLLWLLRLPRNSSDGILFFVPFFLRRQAAFNPVAYRILVLFRRDKKTVRRPRESHVKQVQ